MENNNEIVKTKKKSPIALIICLAVVVVALCTIAFAIAGTEGPDLASKFQNFVAKITGDEEPEETKTPEGGDIVVTDEATLREMLLKEETLSIVVTKDINVGDVLVVNGTKTLSGTKSIIKELDAPEKESVLSVSSGAKLILDGVTIDANGTAIGVEVKQNGKLSSLSGKILYGMPYAISTSGTVEIEDITIDHTLHTGIYADAGGEVYMNGGEILNSVASAIATASGAYAKMSGNSVLRHSTLYLVYNYGKMDITGGKISESGTDSNVIMNKGELNIISATKDYVEIFDSGRSGISSLGGTKLTIDGLYVHDVELHSMNVETNSIGDIRNCIVENTGSRGFYFSTSEVKIQDCQIKNSGKQAAIEVAKDAVVDISNIKISDGNHRGIVVNNGKATIKNVDIKNMVGAGIVTAGKNAVATVDKVTIDTVGKSGLGITGGTIDAKNVQIKNATGDGINITKECKVTLDNVNVSTSGKRGLYIAAGSATLKNSVIDASKQPGVWVEKKSTMNLTSVTIKNSGTHGIANYSGTLITKNVTIDGANNGGIVSKGGTVNGDTTLITNTKSRAVNITEDCKMVMKGLTIPNAGKEGIWVQASDANISNFTVGDTKTAISVNVNSSKVTLKDGTINATAVGINVSSKGEAVAENVKVLRTKGNTQTQIVTIAKNCTLTMTKAGSLIDGQGYEGRGVKTSGTFVLNGGTISNHSAKKTGGSGVYVDEGGNFIMNGGTIENNTATSTSSESKAGGGVFITKTGSFVMNGGAIEKNEATTEGAGVNVAVNGSFTLNGGIIQNNHTAGSGAGICVRGAFNLKGGKIQNNNADNHGAGMILRNTGVFEMTGGTVTGNKANKNGGGIFSQSSSAIVKGGSIKGNTAGSKLNDTGFGSGVYIGTGTFEMTGGTISEHGKETPAANRGAGVYVAKDTTFIMGGTACIEDNHVKSQAGAGVASAGTFVLNGGVIQNNSTAGNGGGILITSDGKFEMTGGTVAGNTGALGGGVFSQSKDATIAGGTIENNTATGASGAGVYVHSGALTMTGGIVSKHGTKEAPVANTGAGVYVASAATFTMDKDAIVEENHANQAGAGIRAEGIFNLNGGTIQKNSTTGNGAGILVTSAGTFNMTGGEVKDNIADRSGAGIYTQSKNTTITGGTIENNTATGTTSEGHGGGVYVHTAGILTMAGGTIQKNTAVGNGGGIYIATTADGAMNKITGGKITENNAVDGGAVYLNTTRDVTMSGMTIQKNTATQNGGGVCVYTTKSFVMKGGTIEGNTAVNGGGVYTTFKGIFTMEDGSIKDNTAVNGKTYGFGSGVYVGATEGTKPFKMTGGTISGHGTKTDKLNTRGAGVYVASGATFTMDKDAIIENNHSKEAGAGVRVDGTFNLNGGKITGNSTTGNGAGVLVTSTGSLTMAGGVINLNEAGKNGGGVYTQSKNTIIKGGSIEGNTAVGTATADGSGAGIYVHQSGTITMEKGTIKGNTANRNGGGIYINTNSSNAGNDAVNAITGGEIAGNTAGVDGGGMYVNTNRVVTLSEIVIEGNTATENGGGINVNLAASVTMESGTIKGNTAVNGGGVYTGGNGPFTLAGGTIEANTATGTTTETVAGMGSAVCVTAVRTEKAAKPFTMSGGTISGHGTAATRSTSLGTVYVAEGSEFKMTGKDAVIEKNFSSQNGAGVYVVGTFTMDNGVIRDNNSAGYGGGIYQDGSVTINGGEVSANKSSKNGGGICVARGKEITIKDGRIEKNSAYNGAGIHADGENKINLTGKGTISENTATGNVVGLFVQESNANKNTSTVTLYTTFTMGNEIRFNNLATRGKEDPILIIKGSIPAGYKLPLGFHNSATVYIQCDSASIASSLVTNIKDNQFKTAWTKFSTDGNYIKASK